MEKKYCARCGKENGTEGAAFCAFCGGELAVRAIPAGEETAALCTRVKEIYAAYINWSSDYIASRPAGRVLSALFTGDSDYKSRGEHQVFIDDCEAAAGQLLENFSDEGCAREKVIDTLDYALFRVHEHCGGEAEWMIFAVEKFYLPFLDKLRAEELADFYERYRAFRKKKMGLPVQDEMLKKMKKLSRGKK